MKLLKTRGQDKKVVPESLQQKWKQKQQILETDLLTDFTMIQAESSYPYMVIQSTEKNQQQQHVKDERLAYHDNHALPHVAEN